MAGSAYPLTCPSLDSPSQRLLGNLHRKRPGAVCQKLSGALNLPLHLSVKFFSYQGYFPAGFINDRLCLVRSFLYQFFVFSQKFASNGPHLVFVGGHFRLHSAVETAYLLFRVEKMLSPLINDSEHRLV